MHKVKGKKRTSTAYKFYDFVFSRFMYTSTLNHNELSSLIRP